MIMGIGTDIVSVSRIASAIKREAFIKRVYTKNEEKYCLSRGKAMAESFAARFAAKEAVLKAFGTGLREGELKEIEVFNDELGSPHIKLYGAFLKFAEEKKIAAVHISLSHEKECAAAFCVMEG